MVLDDDSLQSIKVFEWMKMKDVHGNKYENRASVSNIK